MIDEVDLILVKYFDIQLLHKLHLMFIQVIVVLLNWFDWMLEPDNLGLDSFLGLKSFLIQTNIWHPRYSRWKQHQHHDDNVYDEGWNF